MSVEVSQREVEENRYVLETRARQQMEERERAERKKCERKMLLYSQALTFALLLIKLMFVTFAQSSRSVAGVFSILTGISFVINVFLWCLYTDGQW